jgi:hypothetical protein
MPYFCLYVAFLAPLCTLAEAEPKSSGSVCCFNKAGHQGCHVIRTHVPSPQHVLVQVVCRVRDVNKLAGCMAIARPCRLSSSLCHLTGGLSTAASHSQQQCKYLLTTGTLGSELINLQQHIQLFKR